MSTQVFPVLQSPRLRLRQLTSDDAEAIFQMYAADENRVYIDRAPMTDIKIAKEHIQRINEGVSSNIWYFWAIELEKIPGLIGTICLWNIDEAQRMADVGYELLPDFKGLGYMQEALSKVVDFAFSTLAFDIIRAETQQGNLASLSLLVRNGFTLHHTQAVTQTHKAGKVFMMDLRLTKRSWIDPSR